MAMLMLAAATEAEARDNFIVEHYTQEEGLPSNTVYTSWKDIDGFLWFGTWHGLCSFDGYSFTPFLVRRHSDSDLPPRKVYCIVEDGDGYLWVRDTDNHLYLFDRRKETFVNLYGVLSESTSNVQVIKIQRMENGHVLVLTRDKSLYEANVGTDGKPVLERIFNGSGSVNPATMRLRHNIIGETSTRLFWIDSSFNVYLVEKKAASGHHGDTATVARATMLAGLSGRTDASCCQIAGRYLCVGTTGGIVFVLDMDNGRLTEHSFANVRSKVTSIMPVGGYIYFATSEALYRLSKDGKAEMVTRVFAGGTSPFADSRGRLWMNVKRKAIVSYDPHTNTAHSFPISADSIRDFVSYAEHPQAGVFILTQGGEIWHFDDERQRIEDIGQACGDSDADSHQRFLNLNLDSNNQLWLSSAANGVYKISYPPARFNFIYDDIISASAPPGIENGVRALFETPDGDLWIATRTSQLLEVDAATGDVKRRFSLPANVYHIMADDDNNLWLSTKGAGLIKASIDPLAPQGMRMTTFRASGIYSISSDQVYYTYEDSHRRIWVCTFNGGLNLLEERDGDVLFHNKNNTLSNYPKQDTYINVRAITEDNDGNLWAATTDGLLSVSVDENAKPGDIVFETYNDRTSMLLADNDILSLLRLSNGDILLGTFGAGILKLQSRDGKTGGQNISLSPLTRNNANDVIVAMAEDRQHVVWICAENSLMSYDDSKGCLVRYDRYMGFPKVEIEEDASLLTHDGRVIIGTRRGLIAFMPQQVADVARQSSPTFIVDIKVVNSDVGNGNAPLYEGSPRYVKSIELNHDQNSITLEFATLSFTSADRMVYTYILEGYDEQWHDNGNNRYASYSKLPPGKYVFRVKPADGSGAECSMAITIRPPWWNTWWAWVLWIIIGVVLLFAVARAALYVLKMRNQVYLSDRLAELKLKFFTNVSHELRTPLTLLKAPIEELKAERLSDKGREYLALVDRNAGRMLSLVNDILDFRKVQSGKMKLRISYVNINALVEAFRGEYSLQAQERDIVFRLEMPQEAVMAWVDADKIRVVVSNILSNAFKFTHDGGTIVLYLSAVENAGTARAEGGNSGANGESHAGGSSNESTSSGSRKRSAISNVCRIRVEDDGEPIPNGQLETIFVPYNQASNTSGTTLPGTGIGLSLSREFVTMHGGRIWAENIAGGGGVAFTVELPTDKEHFGDNTDICIDDVSASTAQDDDAVTATPAPEVDNEKPTILLVEDNIDLCRMIRLQIGNLYNIYTAHDGDEGLSMIYKYRPDIIITDLIMPGIDGMELLRRVRKDFNISHTPVVILTARHSEETRLAATEGGANAYVTKPFSSAILTATINGLIEQQRIFQRKIMLNSHADAGVDADAIKDGYEQHLVKKDLMFVEKIRKIIEDNLNTEGFSIDTIAETIGMSRSSFFKKLKALTGFAPVDLVKEIRLSKAAALLQSSDDTITDVAYSVGFHDVGYFAKCFRQKYGKTPKDYRADFRRK